MYLALKTVHVTTVVLSISLFLVRLAWAYTAPAQLNLRWVRVLPHIIDTVLLASAIGLVLVLHQYPFVHAWLTAKVCALIAYILCGSVALKRAKTTTGRTLASIAALASAAYIVAVALAHEAWPFA